MIFNDKVARSFYEKYVHLEKTGITELCLRTEGQSSCEISSNEWSSATYLRITANDKVHAIKRMQNKTS